MDQTIESKIEQDANAIKNKIFAFLGKAWASWCSLFRFKESARSIAIATGVIAIGFWTGGVMWTAIVGAIFTVIGLGLTLQAILPEKYLVQAMKYHLVVDLLFSVVIMVIAGGTGITMIMTGILAGCLNDSYFCAMKEYFASKGHNMDVNYGIEDLIDWIKNLFSEPIQN